MRTTRIMDISRPTTSLLFVSTLAFLALRLLPVSLTDAEIVGGLTVDILDGDIPSLDTGDGLDTLAPIGCVLLLVPDRVTTGAEHLETVRTASRPGTIRSN